MGRSAAVLGSVGGRPEPEVCQRAQSPDVRRLQEPSIKVSLDKAYRIGSVSPQASCIMPPSPCAPRSWTIQTRPRTKANHRSSVCKLEKPHKPRSSQHRPLLITDQPSTFPRLPRLQQNHVTFYRFDPAHPCQTAEANSPLRLRVREQSQSSYPSKTRAGSPRHIDLVLGEST
ncbi:hypothetical protein CC85DRAFT_8490 [Cutaneotrichosporon oleaginosum]|uniref:Uncharacterized protein n=1 Tax=Cutaneotrichosporon oleaginosum TaxID=879819 RepID=A0A0J0XTZ3_9TREE|nr:uncharacterized protein CC85DRAFT_8490 [Cutaneotrichosporon oleaginosum]KLT44540.1 hypothetical protein CC85DRAFT_8490 [Cutaneotrichosporon oleaginosum]TXT13946.1 hypothetical protein COLE_00139 [Cutaneotrichosporon oleaginosum]